MAVASVGCKPPPPVDAPPATSPDVEPPGFEAQLEELDQALERARVSEGIPGMAVAVVRDGDVVWSKGYGLADIDSAKPVTPQTLFGIGSTTKTFTATLAAMQVDAGRIGWDDPIVDHLPWFTMMAQGPDGPVSPTIRDLMTHQAGFTRMALLWGDGTRSLEQVLRLAADAEPIAPLRSGFHYNNVTYSAAGLAVAKAAGGEWESVVEKDLLAPLGMTHTYASQAASREDPSWATGYRRDRDAAVPAPRLDRRGVAPAGAIDSDITDMAKWVRFLLASGVHDGHRLVSDDNLHETWTPQARAWDGMDYGIGWFVQTWHDRRVIEHGGNSDAGFSSEVALLPDEGIGFVLLANVNHTALQQTAIPLVFGTLLGEDVEPTWPPPPPRSDPPPKPESEDALQPIRDPTKKLIGQRRAQKLRRAGQIALHGTVHLRNIGPKGTAELWFTADGRTRFDMDLGPFGHQISIITPDTGWIGYGDDEWTALAQAQLSGMRPTMLPNVLGDWTATYERIEVASADPADDTTDETLTLVLTEQGGQRHTVRLDPRTGDTLEWRTSTPGAPFPAITRWEDFRVVAGVRVPFRQIEVGPLMGETVIQFESVETKRKVDARLFRGDG